MIENQYKGIVENGEFHIRQREPIECNTVRLTRISMQAAQTPESAQIDLSSYEGQTIMVRGEENGCWIYSAELIK
ncbi:hypothetical protein [Paenibacillus sp. NPDC055715]